MAIDELTREASGIGQWHPLPVKSESRTGSRRTSPVRFDNKSLYARKQFTKHSSRFITTKPNLRLISEILVSVAKECS